MPRQPRDPRRHPRPVPRHRGRTARTADGRARQGDGRSPAARWCFPAGGSIRAITRWPRDLGGDPTTSRGADRRDPRDDRGSRPADRADADARCTARWRRCAPRCMPGTTFGEALRGARRSRSISTRWCRFARWLPAHAHMRIFDTRFYLARAARRTRRDAEVDATENVRLFWATAQTVLDDADAGRATIIFPTRRNLERLARFAEFRRGGRRRARASDPHRHAVDRSSATASSISAFPTISAIRSRPSAMTSAMRG